MHRITAPATLLVATFMGILDVAIVTVASPSIQSRLPATFEQVQLVIACYVVAYAVGLVIGGRLGDTYGRKLIFQIGLLFFTLASLLCAAAPNAPLLITARVLQGFAGALMLPQVLSILQVMFEGQARTKVLGFYGATVGAASISGQIIGGLLISLNGFSLAWRWVFLVNVPLGILALIASVQTVPESKSAGATKLDFTGSILLAITIGTLLYPLVTAPHIGWSLLSATMVLVSVMAAMTFIAWERHVEKMQSEPLIRFSLFKSLGFKVGMLIVLAYYGGNIGLYLVLAFFLQSGLHLSAVASGIGYAPLGIGYILSSLYSKRLVERYGTSIMVLGSLLSILSFIYLRVALSRHPSSVSLLPGLFIVGFGQGLIAVSLVGKVLNRISSNVAGLASGALLTVTQIANVLSILITGGIFAYLLKTNGHSYALAFKGCLLWLAVLAAICGLLLNYLRIIENRETLALVD